MKMFAEVDLLEKLPAESFVFPILVTIDSKKEDSFETVASRSFRIGGVEAYFNGDWKTSIPMIVLRPTYAYEWNDYDDDVCTSIGATETMATITEFSSKYHKTNIPSLPIIVQGLLPVPTKELLKWYVPTDIFFFKEKGIIFLNCSATKGHIYNRDKYAQYAASSI